MMDAMDVVDADAAEALSSRFRFTEYNFSPWYVATSAKLVGPITPHDTSYQDPDSRNIGKSKDVVAYLQIGLLFLMCAVI
jgi:hypothetical protein